ncbi:AlpA family phage regulatory protein [uncultured Microbulbifer sp.]|uniref:helix-turn-helix transcriptional regulator n=1 Tax=uncultured Microbulbifer sp. TaxID=348147 RepID=UPI00344E14BF
MSELEKIVDTITEALRGANARLWTSEDIASYLSCSESTVFRLSAKPQFPEPVQIGGVSGRRWVSEEVREWAKKQRPSRRSGPGRPRAVA